MKKFLAIMMLAACLCAAGTHAQTPAGIQPNQVAGEVTALDALNHTVTVKADGVGTLVTVQLSDATKYYRAKPEALTHADKLTPADLDAITAGNIGVGDRLVALGKVAEDQKSVPARVVIIMAKADRAAKEERDREEWRRRGVFGVVSAVNPTTKEITINMRGREGTQPLVIAATETTKFRRYAPDSIKFANAQSSTFAELKVGDQLRARGTRSADGTHFTPEEIVTGSFRNLLATVTTVNAAGGQITVKDNQTKQPLTVVISPDSVVRRVPEQMAQMMAMRGQGGGPGMSGGGAGQRTEGQARPAGQPPAAGAPPQGGEQAGGGGGFRRMGGGPGGGFDVQAMLERLPQVQLAELKPGDVLIVSSTVGADPTRITAINVIAGADTLLAMLQPRTQQGAPAGAGLGSTGLPAGLDFGIGLP